MVIQSTHVIEEFLKSGKRARLLYNKNDKLNAYDQKLLQEARGQKWDVGHINKLDKKGLSIDVSAKHISFCNHHDVTWKEKETIVALDHIVDPFNLGNIIRSCWSFGIKTILLQNKNSAPLHNEYVWTASTGALAHMQFVSISNLGDVLKYLKEKHLFWVYGTKGHNGEALNKISFMNRNIVIIGNEGFGMSNRVEKECDFLVKIPMRTDFNSLNANIACGIILYEINKNQNYDD